jgi:hypothetical protein
MQLARVEPFTLIVDTILLIDISHIMIPRAELGAPVLFAKLAGHLEFSPQVLFCLSCLLKQRSGLRVSLGPFPRPAGTPKQRDDHDAVAASIVH